MKLPICSRSISAQVVDFIILAGRRGGYICLVNEINCINQFQLQTTDPERHPYSIREMTEKRLNELLEGCKKHDRASQRMLYEHFYGVAFGVCLRYSGSREEAKELANDAFLKTFAHMERFEMGKNFGGWLYRIAQRTAIDRYRVAVNQNHHTLGEESLPAFSESVENRLLDRMEIEEKLHFVQQLTPAYRAVFNLFVVEELTHEEIADTLGISVGTSKSNLSKARQQLQRLLVQHKIS